MCFAWSRAIPELLWIYLSRRRYDVLFAMVKNREPYQAPAPALNHHPCPSPLDEEHRDTLRVVAQLMRAWLINSEPLSQSIPVTG